MYIKCLLFRAGRQIVECNHFMLRENATKSFTPQICTEAEINKNPQMCFANVVYIVNVSLQVQMWFSLQMQMWSSLKVFHCKYFITKCFIASVSLQMFHCKCFFIASVFHCKCFFIASVFHCKCFSLQVFFIASNKAT